MSFIERAQHDSGAFRAAMRSFALLVPYPVAAFAQQIDVDDAALFTPSQTSQSAASEAG